MSETLIINGNQNVFNSKEHLAETFLHEIIHAYTSKVIRIIDDPYWREQFKDEYENLPQEVLDAHKKINSIRRGLVSLAKQSDPNFSKKLERVKTYREQQYKISQGKSISRDELVELNPEDVLAYGLIDNLDFVTMATTNVRFREDVDKLGLTTTQKGSILDRLWNALIEFLGLKSMSQVNKDYLTSEIFQYIETVNQSKTNGGSVNIYAGTNENIGLSNLAKRKFSDPVTSKTFYSVEEAFQ